MTYGWAILIMAVVLVSLFSLGVFNGNNISGNTCIAVPGYLCLNPSYSHSNGNIIVTIGQSTGAPWSAVNTVFVQQGIGYTNGIPSISFNSFPANTLLSGSGLTSGAYQTYYLPATGPVNVGTAISGAIWVQYTTMAYIGGQQQSESGYVQIASLNLKAD